MQPYIRSTTTLGHRTQDAIFNRVHGGNLVYNTCWEDPRLDRQMLNILPESRLVMITSAGCNALDYLLDKTSIHEQRDLYEYVRPALWNGVVTWLLRQPAAMTMLGVPRSQLRLIERQFNGGITGYIQSKLEYVLTKIPYWENYFWRVYMTGSYTRECCPNYLQVRHQSALLDTVRRITTHSTTVANFLREHPGSYSHYVLLDHQDWLAVHNPRALVEEWSLILENSRPGTCILMRSASQAPDFIPDFAMKRLQLNAPLAESMHLQDRVGTYGCTLLAHVTT